MGKQINVASFSSPLNSVDDGLASNNVVTSICYKHREKINNSILQAMLNGYAIKAKQYRKYGESHYTYGLPSGTITKFAELDTSKVKPIIEAEVGYPVEIQEAYLAPVMVEYFSMAHARKYWGYTYPGVRMDPYKIPHPNAYYLRPDGAVLLGDNNVRHNFSVSMSPEIETNPTVGHPVPDETFYHIMYTREGQSNDPLEYWFYQKDTGIYPELDNEDINFGSPYLPIVPLRENNKNLGPKIDREVDENDLVTVSFARDENGRKIVPDTELYRTSKKALNKLDIDFDDMCKMVETNPSLDDIDHCYVLLGINLRTETEEGLHYIYQFFKNLYDDYGGGTSGVKVRDSKYEIAIVYESISSSIISGELPKPTVLTFSGDNIILKRRIDENTYERLYVTDPIHCNFIYYEGEWDWDDLLNLEEDDDAGNPGDTGEGIIITRISNLREDEDNLNFLLPLDYFLANEDRSAFNKEDLIMESMQIVYNCYVVTKTEWWEDLLAIFVFALGIALTFVGVGFLVSGFLAAAAQGLLAVLIFAVKVVLINIAVTYIGKLLAELLPPEWLMAVMAVIAIVTATSAWTGLANYPNIMQSVSGFEMSLSKASGYQAEELAKTAEDWSKEAEELTEELEDLWEELETNFPIDYYEILERRMLEYEDESVEEYYNRTIHTGNIGTGIYDIIPNYVEKSLELDKIEMHGFT